MADSSYRTLQAADQDFNAGGPHNVDAETYQDPTYSPHTPSPHVEDSRAGQPYQGVRSSEPTTSTNDSIDEGHHAPESDAPQHDTPFLSGPDVARPSNSQGQTRRDGLKSRFQEGVLDVSAERQNPRWKMFYFRLPFLVSFSVLLALIIAGLEILYRVSQQNQGLATASESMHYAWTYGPTFVLTMVAVSWGQLEQCAKQIMPWSIMSRGDATSKRSLMLNYITSSMLGSLCRSLKRGHFLVSLGILGSLVLRLAIIFSSGLLRLEYKSVISAGEFILQDTFNLTKDVDYIPWRSFIPITNDAGYWGMIYYNMPYPNGVLPQSAVQSFEASEDGSYDDLTGEIQVFESTLEDCDPFSYTYDTHGNPDIYTISMKMSTPDSLYKKLRPWCYDNHVNYDTSGSDDSSGSVAGGLLEEFLNLTQLVFKCTDSDSASRENQDHGILFTSESWISWNVSEVSGFICKPNHSLSRRVVTNTTQNAGIHDNLNITGPITETLDMGLKPFNVTKKILRSLGGEWGQDIMNIKWNTWFVLLNATQPQNNLSGFRNTTLMMELSTQVWQGLSAYVVKHDYMSPSNQTVNGTTTSTQGRLYTQELPLRLMEALIALLLLFSVALCFLRPGVFHRDPTSLGAHAMILARSPDLMGLLEGRGAAPKQALRASLSGILASYPRTHAPESPAIAIQQFQTGSEKPAEKVAADNSDQRKWWRPIPTRLWFRMCILVATLGVMIALEVLLQVSGREDGLGNVSLDGYLKYTWSLLPPFLLALIGLLFSLVDSTARTAHPFQLLRKGRAGLADILYDPARQVSLMAVGRAAWKRHFPLLWATLPGLLAPVLTIVTSGLYTVNPVPWTYDAELQLQDWFSFRSRTELPATRDDEGWTTFKLMEFNDMPYPNWTHGSYAFSRFGADNLRSHDGNDTALYVTTHVPATRYNMNCTLIGHYAGESYQTLNSTSFNSPTTGTQYLRVDPRPLGCDTAPEGNQTTGHRDLWITLVQYTNDLGASYIGGNYSFLAQYQNNYHGYYLDRYNQSVEAAGENGLCGDEREHRFYALGKGSDELAMLHCVPYVEGLLVNATFSLPDLSLVTDVPIEPDMDSSVFLSDSLNLNRTSSSNFDWKLLVSALVNGTSGVGWLSTLMPGPGDVDGRKLTAAVEDLLGEYYAQEIHFNSREPLDGNYSDDNPFTRDGQPVMGKVTDLTRLRLVQNEVSTRVLQCILGVMAVSLVAASVLDRGVRIIPRDPGSVASRMAYFAGGAMWRDVPVGADRWKDEEIIKWGRENSEGRLLLDWRGGDDPEASDDGAPPSEERARRFAVDSASRKGVA